MTLIERLEALTGPCRECDALILQTCFPDEWSKLRHEASLPCGAPEKMIIEQVRVYVDHRKQYHYTASFDAAMTLVPEGWCHGYRWSVKHKTARAFCEFIPVPPFAPEELLSRESRNVATPAIALCIAALKATQ